MIKSEPIKLTVQLVEVKTKPDGAIRISFECGLESLEGAQELLKRASLGDKSFAMALVEYDG